jgi:hypothetical protein
MNWSVLKEFKSQIITGLGFGTIGVLGTGVISWLLLLPFPDLYVTLIQLTIGLGSILASLLIGNNKGRWAIYYWFGAALLTPVCSGVLWAAFAWLTGFNPIYLDMGFWLSLAGFSIIFVLTFTLFSFLSTTKITSIVSAETTPNLTKK